jgi:hypothetical protein
MIAAIMVMAVCPWSSASQGKILWMPVNLAITMDRSEEVRDIVNIP